MISVNGKPISVTMFPDNTSQVWKLEEDDLQNGDIHVKWVYSNESEVMHLLQLSYLLYNISLSKRILEITYLPYARQDKPIGNWSTYALHPFADVLNAMRFDEVIIHDPHSVVSLDNIENSRAVYPTQSLFSIIGLTLTDLLCYPDKGAISKYTQLLNTPYSIHTYLYGEKVRDQLTGNITDYKLIGDPSGKNVLIVDDICDGGATFKLLTMALLEAGAKKVNLFVTHGIFSKGVRTLKEAGIDRIFTEDGEVSERFNKIQA